MFIFQDQGVKVFVLLYKEVEMAIGINSYYSKQRLISANPENIKVKINVLRIYSTLRFLYLYLYTNGLHWCQVKPFTVKVAKQLPKFTFIVLEKDVGVFQETVD